MIRILEKSKPISQAHRASATLQCLTFQGSKTRIRQESEQGNYTSRWGCSKWAAHRDPAVTACKFCYSKKLLSPEYFFLYLGEQIPYINQIKKYIYIYIPSIWYKSYSASGKPLFYLTLNKAWNVFCNRSYDNTGRT